MSDFANKFESDYRNWLVASMNVVPEKNYGPLLRELYRREFYSLVQYDEDRASDGTALRATWAEETGYPGDTEFGPCSVLEALIGIAMRVEFQLFGSRWADEWDYKKIFWHLIDNLGLLGFEGDLTPLDYEKIVTVSENFCNRKYRRDGFGNIFCIFEAEKDLRKLNIWTQMGLYIRQKWPI